MRVWRRLTERWTRRGVPADAAAAGRLLERAIAAHRERDWAAAEPLFRAVIAAPRASSLDRQVARNMLGNLLVRTRRQAEAIATFEANVAEGFGGSYPYERLAEIYRRQGRPAEAARVLGRAVEVVAGELGKGRAEVEPRLDRLRAALAEVERERDAGG